MRDEKTGISFGVLIAEELNTFSVKLTLEERVFSYQIPYLQKKVLEVPLTEMLTGKLLE